VTCHRCGGFADLSAKQSRVQRLAGKSAPPSAFDGDKSPAKSADKSAHSKAADSGCAPLRKTFATSALKLVVLLCSHLIERCVPWFQICIPANPFNAVLP
jgi:hypothetical protein